MPPKVEQSKPIEIKHQTKPKIDTNVANFKTEIDEQYVSPLKSAMVENSNTQFNQQKMANNGNKSQMIP